MTFHFPGGKALIEIPGPAVGREVESGCPSRGRYRQRTNRP